MWTWRNKCKKTHCGLKYDLSTYPCTRKYCGITILFCHTNWIFHLISLCFRLFAVATLVSRSLGADLCGKIVGVALVLISRRLLPLLPINLICRSTLIKTLRLKMNWTQVEFLRQIGQWSPNSSQPLFACYTFKWYSMKRDRRIILVLCLVTTSSCTTMRHDSLVSFLEIFKME